MRGFVAGFVTATAIWGVVLGICFVFGLPSWSTLVVSDTMADAGGAEASEPATGSGRRRPRRAPGSAAGQAVPRGQATTGDEAGAGELRTIDMDGPGGEQQLTGAQVEAAMDGVMPRVRRCFMLAAGEDAVAGRLTFGLRIAGAGQVTRVNLAGPAVLTTGDAGECLRAAARGARFPTFNGPEMVVHFPIDLGS